MNIHAIPVLHIYEGYPSGVMDEPPQPIYLDFDRVIALEPKGNCVRIIVDDNNRYTTLLPLRELLAKWKSETSSI